ncbi:hypothetical protein AB0A98_41535, partial [Streptomyces chrestomyceticus]
MPQIMDARLGRDVGLTALSQDVAVRSLLPIALSGLPAGEAGLVRRGLEKMKLLRLEPATRAAPGTTCVRRGPGTVGAGRTPGPAPTRPRAADPRAG